MKLIRYVDTVNIEHVSNADTFYAVFLIESGEAYGVCSSFGNYKFSNILRIRAVKYMV